MSKSSPPWRRQPQRLRGASLTEMMVGLALGLLVLLVALSSLAATQLSTYALLDSVRLQQKAEDLLHNIGTQVAQAGAIQLLDSANNSGQVFFSSAYGGYDPAVTQSQGRRYAVHGVDHPGGGSDTLRVSNEDNRNRRDCLGVLPAGRLRSDRIDSQYRVNATSLQCLGNGAPRPQPLADGVEDFQLRYGIRSGTGAATRFAFFDANQLSDWSSIQSVSVCLQLVGESRGHAAPATPLIDCHGQPLDHDGRMRRVYQRSFSVRNALP